MYRLKRAADSIRRLGDSVRRLNDSLSRRPTDSSHRIIDTFRKDTLRFPLYDRRGDRITNPNRNPFDLKDPANIHDSVEYDPVTKQYYVVEKVGNQYYRKPTYLTFDELMQMQSQNSEDDYWRKRADALDALNRKLLRPRLSVSDNLFNRIFGNGKIDIRPQGNVDITAGYAGQSIQNPTLPESARRTGGFDFKENANLQVVGNIGDKLKLPISYNTLANFDFENQLKLDYTGGPDEIIKKVEAGNVSFTTPSTLMTGAQSLIRSLEAVGADTVFGIPGGAILPAYDPLMDSTKVRHILVRHEQGAGHAATGYAQATGKVGVCMATSGPGATNLVTPIADAHMDSVPIVAITGQVASKAIGTDAFQEADICGITCRSPSKTSWSVRPPTSRGPSPRRSTSPPPAAPARCSWTSPRTRCRTRPPSAGRRTRTCPATAR